MSNDPAVAGLADIPESAVCEFCGAERHVEGINFFGRFFWNPSGATPCTCPEGTAEYRRICAEREAKEAAEEKELADKKMRERVSRVIGESGMGERFLQRTFQNYVADTPDRKRVSAAARGYAEAFEQRLPRRGKPLPGRNGFFIHGPKGTGKTHIVAAIANSILNAGTAAVCMTERELLGRIRRTYSHGNGDESDVLEVYKRVPLLIIDDLGKEKPSEWTLATLYAIIDGRYERAMPTIVTTNYDPVSLLERMTPKGGDITTADAIVDRLNEMCESIFMDGGSWRSR
jgi:DNA replication protein DnaC